jgi:hypothetical protein
LRYATLSLLLVSLVFAQCAFQSAESLLKTTTPAEPENDSEMVISRAVNRALIEQKDLPGYELIRERDRIVISNQIGSGPSGETFGAGGLPDSPEIAFTLLSPNQIERLASLRGDFPYLCILMLTIEEETATIQLGVLWAKSRWSHDMHPRRGYILLYHKKDAEWVFEEVITGWSA